MLDNKNNSKITLMDDDMDRPYPTIGEGNPIIGEGNSTIGERNPITRRRNNEQLEFTGTIGEYFRIWLTNNILIVLTLGLYYPWAIVRKRKYFYTNMKLQGHYFDYTAKATSLFKGFLILILSEIFFFASIFGVIFAYRHIGGKWTLVLILIIILLSFALSLFFIVNALRFRAYHTRYKNIRFSFRGTNSELATIILQCLLWFIVPIVGYIKLLHKTSKFYYGNLYLGSKKIREDIREAAFTKFYFVIPTLIYLVVFFSIWFITQENELGKFIDIIKDTENSNIINITSLALFSLIGFVSRWGIKRHIWNSISIANILSIRSKFSLFKLSILNLFYLFLSLITLGLFLPVRSILITKYIVKNTKIISHGDSINSITNIIAPSVSGIGEASLDGVDMGGFDFGI